MEDIAFEQGNTHRIILEINRWSFRWPSRGEAIPLPPCFVRNSRPVKRDANTLFSRRAIVSW